MRSPASIVVALLSVLMAGADLRGQAFDHSVYDSVLAAHVRGGQVDYSALAAQRDALDRYVEQLGAVTADEFAGWSEADRIAYLINAYNAVMLKIVIDHYPIEPGGFFTVRRHAYPNNSVRQIDGVFDGIRHRVAGELMTLDDIEHGRLRANYSEPRIHFALVCAALSCPPLRDEAYTGGRLDAQLDDQGEAFMNDPTNNRVDSQEGVVYLSKIFDWFGEDFAGFAPETGYAGDRATRGVLAFVSRYLPEPEAEYLREGHYRVEFLDYDWTLNDVALEAAFR